MIIFAGTSGIVLPIPRSSYPPGFHNSSRLSYYSSLYNSVEINSTFYKRPRRATIERWLAEAGKGFQFTFKVPGTISHAPQLDFDPADYSSFLELVNIPKESRGCLLIQLPPSTHVSQIGKLKKLLNVHIRRTSANYWRLAVEFRHSSWYIPKVFSILEDVNAALVIHDMPASAPPENTVTADFTYIRFHGPGGRYRGTYSDGDLERIADWLNGSRKYKTAYLYFNNTMGTANADLDKLLLRI